VPPVARARGLVHDRLGVRWADGGGSAGFRLVIDEVGMVVADLLDTVQCARSGFVCSRS
jgi:hypothetical protein